MPKEDLLSQEVRQQRRALQLAVGTAGCLLLLVASATWQWRVAESERALKVEQLRQAQINESGQLGAQAREAAARGNVELANILLSRALPKDLAAPDRPLATSAAAAMVPVLAADSLRVRFLVGHTAAVTRMTFSPDGTRILTVSDDKTARVWDASTGLCLLILEDGQIMIHSAAFSADGSRVIASARDGTKLAWSATSGAPLESVPNDDESASAAVRLGRDDKKLVVAPEGHARIVDAATGVELMVLGSNEGFISGGEFNPDGSRVVTSSFNDSITIWDAATGKPIRVLKGVTDEFRPIFGPDGRKILGDVHVDPGTQPDASLGQRRHG